MSRRDFAGLIVAEAPSMAPRRNRSACFGGFGDRTDSRERPLVISPVRRPLIE